MASTPPIINPATFKTSGPVTISEIATFFEDGAPSIANNSTPPYRLQNLRVDAYNVAYNTNQTNWYEHFDGNLYFGTTRMSNFYGFRIGPELSTIEITYYDLYSLDEYEIFELGYRSTMVLQITATNLEQNFSPNYFSITQNFNVDYYWYPGYGGGYRNTSNTNYTFDFTNTGLGTIVTRDHTPSATGQVQHSVAVGPPTLTLNGLNVELYPSNLVQGPAQQY